MIKVGIIGVGNAGNQVAACAKKAGFKAIALNSSEKDLATVRDILTTVIIGDEKGAGKDRNTAKSFIKEAIQEVLTSHILDEVILDHDVVMIVSSTGGGTGSGMAPLLQAVLSNTYPEVQFIIVGIVPTLSESLASQRNSVEYLKEMKMTNPTYMLVDNGKFEGQGTVSMFQRINLELVEDFKVIRGDYQISTPYASIDEKDSMKFYTTPGRLVIGRASGYREKDLDQKSIEQRIIDNVKNGHNVELETDRSVKRSGLIINLTPNLYSTMDTTMPEVVKAFGEPIEGFEHLAVADNLESSSIVLLAGLSFPDDRIVKTVQRIDEVQSKLGEEKSSIIDSINIDGITDIRKDNRKEVAKVSLEDIMGGY